MLINEMESYLRIGERNLKNLTYPYMGVGWVKNFQNHPYVINEWSLLMTTSTADKNLFCVTKRFMILSY